jgi:hypothetical protein
VSREFHIYVMTAVDSAVNENLAAVCLTSVGRGTGGLRRFGLLTGPAGDELVLISADARGRRKTNWRDGLGFRAGPGR